MSALDDGTDRVAPESVGDLGEFELIDRLAGLVSGTTAVVGIGDDAAVLDVGGPDYLLATVDMVVQGVHFEFPGAEPRIVGRRALAINVSDIAAMGGQPTFALVSVALPPACSPAFVEEIYRGLAEEAALNGMGIVGGNVTRTEGPICIDVTVLGQAPRDEVVLRSGACRGDLLAVTGTLGAAAARRQLTTELNLRDPAVHACLEELPAVPTARIAAGRALASAHLAHAMVDLSDGLAGDLHHLCAASGVGAVIRADRLPISAATRSVAIAVGAPPESFALTGGEDYELLVALAPDDAAEARRVVGDLPLTVIGEVVSELERVTIVGGDGEPRELRPAGWTHF